MIRCREQGKMTGSKRDLVRVQDGVQEEDDAAVAR